MKFTFKIFLIIFLATSITFGIMIYFSKYFDSASNQDNILWPSIISAGIFGLIMSIFIVVMQKTRLKKAGYPKLTNTLLKVRQTKTINSNISKEDLIDLLKSNSEYNKSKIKHLSNSIVIRKKMSWFSWGEIITITFSSNHEIKIKSKPSLPITLIDYGVNIENVDKVISIIKTV